MPWRAPPSSSVIQTRASTRRTPSTKATPAGGAVPAGGRRGAQSAASTSTPRSTGSVPPATADSSVGAPYSGAQASTANRRGGTDASTSDAPPTARSVTSGDDLGDGGAGRVPGDLEAHRHALGQLGHVADQADHPPSGPELLDGGRHRVERV